LEPVHPEGVAYSLKRYLSIKSAYAPDFSPDGRRLAYLTDMTGVPQVWEVALAGSRAPQQITLEDERVGFVSVASKSGRMAYGVDHGGSERFQIHMLERGGDSVVKLTDAPDVIHTWGDWSPDETAVAFSSNARDRASFDVYVERLSDLSAEMVYRCEGNAHAVAWSPDGASLLFEVEHAPFDHDLFLLDLARRKARLLTPHKGEAAFYSPTFDASGRHLYVATDKGREFVALARIDVSTRRLEYVYA
jgi:Tol biopolymer transport system component